MTFLVEDPLVGLWLGRLLVAMGAAIVISVAFLLCHHALTVRRETRRRLRIVAAAEELAPCLASRAEAPTAVARAVRSWGRPVVSTVLRRARRCLAGEAERAVSALLEGIGETRRLAQAARRGGAAGADLPAGTVLGRQERALPEWGALGFSSAVVTATRPASPRRRRRRHRRG